MNTTPAITFTVAERASLLRAVRQETERITDNIMRLDHLGRNGKPVDDQTAAINSYRIQAEIERIELLSLASATRKLWGIV